MADAFASARFPIQGKLVFSVWCRGDAEALAVSFTGLTGAFVARLVYLEVGLAWINAGRCGSAGTFAGSRLFSVWFLISGISAAALRADMVLDPAFDSGYGTEQYCEHVIPLADGKILVCGAFQWYDLKPAPFITRLNEDGTMDPIFKMGVINGWIRHMVLQPDGKIVVGGAFSGAGGVSRNLIARLNADGSFDSSFDPGTGFEEKLVPPDPNPPYVFWMDRQPDGKIIAVGSFAKFNGQTAHGIARLNPDGSLDRSFQIGSGLDSWARFVMVQPNGQIIVTGWFTDYNGFACNRMVRLNSDGTPDPTFHPYFGDKTAIYHATLLPDGKMLVSGHSKSDFNLFKREIARLNPDGSQDDTFLGRTDNRTESILLQPDGKFIVCGWFDLANASPHGRLARFNADGSVDDTFNAEADYMVWNMAFDSKRRLLIVGGFPDVMGVPRSGIARFVDASAVTPPSSGGDTNSSTNSVSSSGAGSGVPLSADVPDSITIQGERMIGGAFELSIQTTANHRYFLEHRTLFTDGTWNTVDSLAGDGAVRQLYDLKPGSESGCYRVRAE